MSEAAQGAPVQGKGEVIRLKREAPKGEEAFEPAVYQPKWVPTNNERNLEVVMSLVTETPGKSRLITLTGDPGFGKSETSLKWASDHECVHMLIWGHWKSPLPFVQGLCREYGVSDPPRRTNDCVLLLIQRIMQERLPNKTPKPIFLDEIDLTPQHLNMIRQLSEATGAPFVLIGEKNTLEGQVTGAGRFWSRTFQSLQFEPVALSDLLYYLKRSTGFEVDPEAGAQLHQTRCGKDWRDLERVTVNLVEIANSKRTKTITEEMVEIALKMTLKNESMGGVQVPQSPFKRGKR